MTTLRPAPLSLVTDSGTAPDSTVHGAPISVLADLHGGPRIDDVLRRAASEHPDKLALRDATGSMTYAELDRRVDACALALREQVGFDDTAWAENTVADGAERPLRPVVAITLDLDIAFATLFFGVARAGLSSALVSPLLRPEQLTHVFRTSGAEIAFVSGAVFEELASLRDRLPALRDVLHTTRPAFSLTGARSLPEIIEDVEVSGPVTSTAGADDTALLQFTNGTTGALKAVRLSHANLCMNAAQFAFACDLDERAVMLNNLPTFHLMHLMASTTARASQILNPTTDSTEAMDEVCRSHVTHLYSLPVRLIKLADDPRLQVVEAPSLRVIMSGGSGMPPHAVTALTSHLGVPVIQGYGMAEASPIVCCDTPARPRDRSCGRPVPGASIRVVDVTTREVLERGEKGELQIRGPQLMQGYLGRARAHDVDQDGWFTTGDVGILDEDGYLFIVDRIKDVFKCDNWLVSPTEIERVLLQHPGVADAVVVDYPHPTSGAVAYAVVVAREEGLDPQSVQDFVAARLPYYDHVQHVEFTDVLPRTANGGKVLRREVRDRVHAAAALRPRP